MSEREAEKFVDPTSLVDLGRLMTSKEVAAWLSVTEPTLARWRSEGR